MCFYYEDIITTLTFADVKISSGHHRCGWWWTSTKIVRLRMLDVMVGGYWFPSPSFAQQIAMKLVSTFCILCHAQLIVPLFSGFLSFLSVCCFVFLVYNLKFKHSGSFRKFWVWFGFRLYFILVFIISQSAICLYHDDIC